MLTNKKKCIQLLKKTYHKRDNKATQITLVGHVERVEENRIPKKVTVYEFGINTVYEFRINKTKR
jgi:hypothetical protein